MVGLRIIIHQLTGKVISEFEINKVNIMQYERN